VVNNWRCLVGLPSPNNRIFQAPGISGKEFFLRNKEAFSSHKIFGDSNNMFSSVFT
tara:strand:- start:432 stop:599 length:168 start_codon:yes stop_codon:yes gene_type:complete